MNINNISSFAAYDLLLEDHNNSILIDVRTSKEWQEIGVPKLEKNNLTLLSWRLLPNMIINKEFENKFVSLINDKMYFIFFLCRRGIRSLEAARFAMNIISLDHINYYNIYDGFEGNVNGAGWKQNNLPWQIL